MDEITVFDTFCGVCLDYKDVFNHPTFSKFRTVVELKKNQYEDLGISTSNIENLFDP